MKKNYLSIYISAFSILLFLLFLNFVQPAIDRPLVLFGFYTLLFTSLFSTVFSITFRIASNLIKIYWSLAIAIGSCYLVALSSLKQLSLLQVSIAVTIIGVLFYILRRSQSR